MKHGGYKDTKELFALATIAEELQRRSTKETDIKWRLPEYRMLYISPCHLRETPRELWSVISKALGFTKSPKDNNDHSDRSSHASLDTSDSGDIEGMENRT